MDNELLYYIWLQGCFGLNPSRFPAAMKKFGSAQAVFSASVQEYVQSGFFSDTELERLSDKSLVPAEKILRQCESSGITAISYADARYPSRLRDIIAPPVVLYVLGKMIPQDVSAVGIVGTRYPFDEFRSTAYSFARGLAQRGAAVISGGAIGIDYAAHLGAAENDGITACVIGCGIDLFSDKNKKDLRRLILEKGAIVSEYPPRMPAAKYTFPMRDRLISGMSDCVLVVQAGTGSGSLITARAAIKQKRKLFFVPGQAFSERCFGNNAMIRAGFSVALDHNDIVGWLDKHMLLPDEQPNPPLTPEVIQILSKKITLPHSKSHSRSLRNSPDGYELSLMLKDMVPDSVDFSGSTVRNDAVAETVPSGIPIDDIPEPEEKNAELNVIVDEAPADALPVKEDEYINERPDGRSFVADELVLEASMLPGADLSSPEMPGLVRSGDQSGIIDEYGRIYKRTLRTADDVNNEETDGIDLSDDGSIDRMLQKVRSEGNMKFVLPPSLDFVSEEYRSFVIDVLRYRARGLTGPYKFMDKDFIDALFLPKKECYSRIIQMKGDDFFTSFITGDTDVPEELTDVSEERTGTVSSAKDKTENNVRKDNGSRASVKIDKTCREEKGKNIPEKEKLNENSSKRLTEAALAVYDTFSDTSMSIDSIILASGKPVNVVVAALTELQASGLVKTVPGGKFMKS